MNQNNNQGQNNNQDQFNQYNRQFPMNQNNNQVQINQTSYQARQSQVQSSQSQAQVQSYQQQSQVQAQSQSFQQQAQSSQSQGGVRMISPEQVCHQTQKQQMTQEELQRTQVLNLKDVEETVKFEKLTSKKPAIVAAVIGIFCLTIGSSFAFIQSMTARKVDEEKKVESRKTVAAEKSDITSLVCTQDSPNEPDGTGKSLVYTFVFKNKKLKSFTKTFSIIPTTIGSPESQQLVQGYISALQSYLVNVDGYKITVAPESTGGVITTTEVNYDLLNIESVPQLNQNNFRFNVPYQKETSYDAIKSDLTNQGYKCQ